MRTYTYKMNRGDYFSTISSVLKDGESQEQIINIFEYKKRLKTDIMTIIDDIIYINDIKCGSIDNATAHDFNNLRIGVLSRK